MRWMVTTDVRDAFLTSWHVRSSDARQMRRRAKRARTAYLEATAVLRINTDSSELLTLLLLLLLYLKHSCC
jgi:hypothetical protein